MASDYTSLHPDTPVLMYFGTIKTLKNVQKGDILMGDDYQPRVVRDVSIRVNQLYKVIPNEGDSFCVSKGHLLTLYNAEKERVIDLPVDDFITKPADFQRKYQLFSIPIEYNKIETKNDPYLIGMILGNKNHSKLENIIKEYLFKRLESLKDLINDNIKKLSLSSIDDDEIHQIMVMPVIPNEYLYNSRQIRIKFLKGFIEANTTINFSDKVEKAKPQTPKTPASPSSAKSVSSTFSGTSVSSHSARIRSRSSERLNKKKPSLSSTTPIKGGLRRSQSFKKLDWTKDDIKQIRDLSDDDEPIELKSDAGPKINHIAAFRSKIPMLKRYETVLHIPDSVLAEQVKFLVKSIGMSCVYIDGELTIYGNIDGYVAPGRKTPVGFSIRKIDINSSIRLSLVDNNRFVMGSCIVIHN